MVHLRGCHSVVNEGRPASRHEGGRCIAWGNDMQVIPWLEALDLELFWGSVEVPCPQEGTVYVPNDGANVVERGHVEGILPWGEVHRAYQGVD